MRGNKQERTKFEVIFNIRTRVRKMRTLEREKNTISIREGRKNKFYVIADFYSSYPYSVKLRLESNLPANYPRKFNYNKKIGQVYKSYKILNAGPRAFRFPYQICITSPF